jgi:hypothetical protein
MKNSRRERGIKGIIKLMSRKKLIDKNHVHLGKVVAN